MCNQGGLSPHEAPPHFFVVVNFAQVALLSAAPEGDVVVAAPEQPAGLFGGPSAAPPFGSAASCGSGGGGKDDPPDDKWQGILAELIVPCSGAVLLGVYRCTHLYIVCIKVCWEGGIGGGAVLLCLYICMYQGMHTALQMERLIYVCFFFLACSILPRAQKPHWATDCL